MFVISKLLWLLLEPSNLLIILLVAGVAFCWRDRNRLGRPLVIGTTAAMLLLMLLPFEQWLAMPLEARFPKPPLPRRVDGILVLSGGFEPEILSSRGVPGHEWSDQRLIAGVELARLFPQARLVFSGGSGKAFGGESEASVARVIFSQLGVPKRRLVFEDTSRTTWENLVNSQRLVHPKAGETWVLVTSAFHLPRAMGVAEHLHWKMIPWPAAYVSAANGHVMGRLDYAQSTATFEVMVHEWLGLLTYRLEGRTDTLLP